MESDSKEQNNPLKVLKNDIQALEQRERIWAEIVQVPRKRAHELVGMNAEKWCDGSSGFLNESQIDKILRDTCIHGASALNGLTFGFCRITVASGVESDCSEVKIIKGKPMDI